MDIGPVSQVTDPACCLHRLGQAAPEIPDRHEQVAGPNKPPHVAARKILGIGYEGAVESLSGGLGNLRDRGG